MICSALLAGEKIDTDPQFPFRWQGEAVRFPLESVKCQHPKGRSSRAAFQERKADQRNNFVRVNFLRRNADANQVQSSVLVDTGYSGDGDIGLLVVR